MTPDRSDSPLSRAAAVLLVVATLAVLWWHGKQVQFFCDDSYISYRYSQNFAEGKGLVYNEGERVEGYTNFLWVVLVGAAMKLGVEAEPASLGLGVAFLLVTLGATVALARRLLGSLAFALVPAFLLVCQGPMVLWSVSGLEASCYAAITMLAVLAYERWFSSWKGLLGAGALYAASAMVRPDGVVFGGAAGLHLVACGLLARPLRLGAVAGRALALAAGFVALFAPFVLWRHSYYGDWLPNTFYVKAGGLLNVRLGVQYLTAWLVDYPIAAALAIGGCAAALLLPRHRGQRRTFAHLTLALALFCAYLLWAGGDYMALYRFLVPLLPLAMIPGAALLKTLHEGAARVLPSPATAALAVLLLASSAYAFWQPSRRSLEGESTSYMISHIQRMKRNSEHWSLIGKALREKLPPQTTLAVTAAGALPFFAGMPTLDQSGLCDRYTAKVSSDPWMLDRPGHMKQATRARIAEWRPDLVFWHPKVDWAGKPAEQFQPPPTGDYELRAMGVPGLAEDGLCVYFWVHQRVAPALVAHGVVPVSESARLANADAIPEGAIASPAPPETRRDARALEIEAELAELNAEPPPRHESVDPPLPEPRAGPVLATTRVEPIVPSADEPRISVGDVTRPLWTDLTAEFDLRGSAGSFVELEVASAPSFRDEPDPEGTDGATRSVMAERPGATKPARVEVAFVTEAGKIALPVTTSTAPFAAEASWLGVRADCSAIPPARGRLEVAVDGSPIGAGSRWLASAPRICQDSDAQDRPNVLIVTIDTLRADYLGCYGHDRPTSPRIDRLASEGVLFERAISQANWTLPSYSSIFSGLYVESHGVVHRDHPFAGRFVTFVEKLAQAGYLTGAIVSGTFTDSLWGFDQGFDSYDDLGMIVDESRTDSIGARDGSSPDSHEGMRLFAHKRVTSPEVANKAIAWLDAHRDRRFALFLHFFDPHEDYVQHPGLSERFPPRPVPPEFPNRIDPKPEVTALMRARYEAEIAYTDSHVGRVLDRLDALGLSANTVVVVCADHGEAFKEHLIDVVEDMRNLGHGGSLFNEQVHVPLIVRAPGIAPGRVSAPVGNIDIGPTLIELCRAEGEGFGHDQGFSLVPLLEDPEGARGEPVLTSQYRAIENEAAHPPGTDRTNVRTHIAHRLDHEDLCAIEYATIGARKGAEYLFDGADRWQDWARNLKASLGEEFEKFRAYYRERRPQLDAVLQDSSALDIDAERKILEELGYIEESRDE